MSKKKTENINVTLLQICANIKNARKAKGLSQEDMAEQMEITRATYKNWEDETVPDLSTIKTIAEILSVPAFSLLSGVIDFPAHEIIKFNEDQRSKALTEVRVSLSTLTSAIGRLAGLDTGQVSDLLLGVVSDNTGFEYLRGGKLKDRKKPGNT